MVFESLEFYEKNMKKYLEKKFLITFQSNLIMTNHYFFMIMIMITIRFSMIAVIMIKNMIRLKQP